MLNVSVLSCLLPASTWAHCRALAGTVCWRRLAFPPRPTPQPAHMWNLPQLAEREGRPAPLHRAPLIHGCTVGYMDLMLFLQPVRARVAHAADPRRIPRALSLVATQNGWGPLVSSGPPTPWIPLAWYLVLCGRQTRATSAHAAGIHAGGPAASVKAAPSSQLSAAIGCVAKATCLLCSARPSAPENAVLLHSETVIGGWIEQLPGMLLGSRPYESRILC